MKTVHKEDGFFSPFFCPKLSTWDFVACGEKCCHLNTLGNLPEKLIRTEKQAKQNKMEKKNFCPQIRIV
jgi:hypothetical protein